MDGSFTPSFLTEEDLNEDLGLGFKLDYSQQYLTDKVILEESGETVTIIDKFREECVSRNVKIVLENGEEKIITTDDILVPYNS